MPKLISNTKMKQLCFEITKEQYFFLKEKALLLQKQNQKASISSIIRDLIEKEQKRFKNKAQMS